MFIFVGHHNSFYNVLHPVGMSYAFFSWASLSSEEVTTVVASLYVLLSEAGFHNRSVSHPFSFLEAVSLSVELIGYCLIGGGLINSFPA